MTSNEKTATLINSLIEINNDRIEGYEKAVKETDDNDLKSLFNRMSEESRKLRSELTTEVVSYNGKPTESTRTTGKFFRAWMDVKAAITNHDPKAILSSCEFGEDAAKEAYDDVLKEDLPSKTRDVITKQRQVLQQSHDQVKHLRDAAAAMH